MGLDGDPNLLATLRSKDWKDLPDAQNYRGGDIPKTVEDYEASVKQRFGDSANAVLALYPAKSPDEAYWQEVAIRTDSASDWARGRNCAASSPSRRRRGRITSAISPRPRAISKRGVSHVSELA